MSEWVKAGSRYINLCSVSEVRVAERGQLARVFYVGGGVDLREEDAEDLIAALEERAVAPETPRRTVIAPAAD